MNTIIRCILFTLFIFSQCNCLYAQSREVPFTQDDRDRLIRLEERLTGTNERIDGLEKQMNTRFDAINDKFDAINDKFDKLYNLIYFILAGVFGLVGLIFWDRRSYIKPVKEDITEIVNVLREHAKDQPKLAEILRSHGLM